MPPSRMSWRHGPRCRKQKTRGAGERLHVAGLWVRAVDVIACARAATQRPPVQTVVSGQSGGRQDQIIARGKPVGSRQGKPGAETFQ